MAFKFASNRNSLIVSDYTKMFFTDGLREEIVLEKLSEKYFLATSTIYRIVLAHNKKAKNN